MARRIAAGIDVGTQQVKVVIAKNLNSKRGFIPALAGVGLSESKGLRHGYIINHADTMQSISTAIEAAEKAAGVRIKQAYLSVGGIGLEELRSKGEVMISRADGEVTDLDIDKALADTEAKVEQKIINRKIIHTIPLRFKVDGREVLGRPQGMRGSKLEVEALFITSLEQHLNDLIGAVEELGIEVEDVMASPLSGSLVTLSKAQKIAGCVLANIGAETVSIVVFENGIPVSLKVFPIGGADITNDIALGLRISLEEAEQIKHGAITNSSFPKKKLDEIVFARLSDIFELIESHLKKLGKNGLLPAGVILTGGGSGIATIEEYARASLKLPSRLADPHISQYSRGQIKDSTWAVAYGLCIWGLQTEEDSAGIRLAKKTGGSMLAFFKQFLP